MSTKFKWFWEDQKELALWRKIQDMTPEEFNKLEPYIKQRLKQQYGNIYFFKPYPAQEPILKDESGAIYVHGNNSSGKSYCCAAKTAYHVIGWSPYFTVPQVKYGYRTIWAFSPTMDIQRTSSQVHLFSTDNPNDIGLLPPFNTIEAAGGRVAKGKNNCLDFVRFPNGTVLEFKSAEQKTYNLQASGVDFVFFDEYPPQSTHDEIVARCVRKGGRMIVSFIVEDPQTNYIVTDIYSRFENGDLPDTNFFFLDISDNLSLSKEEIEMVQKRISGAGAWRFRSGGKWVTEATGLPVYKDASQIHIVDDLLEQYDPLRVLWRSWDLGFRHPVCIGIQLDKLNRKSILFALMGTNIQLTDFIDEVESFCKENLPRVIVTHELLPHDAHRVYDVSPDSSLDIFKKKGLRQYTVTYSKRDASILTVNQELSKLTDKIPNIRVDAKYAALVASCFTNYRRDEKDQKPKLDGYYEHISDALKQAIYFFSKSGDVNVTYEEPTYFRTDVLEQKQGWLH